MCGIFGSVISPKSGISNDLINQIIEHLSKYSETRGSDSSGIAFINNQHKQIDILKTNQKITYLTNMPEFKKTRANYLKKFDKQSFSFMGHSRLVTHGSQLNSFNNQPVIKDGIVSIHNGIIVNFEKLWEKYDGIKQEYQIDTEIVNSLFNLFISQGLDFTEAFKKVLSELEGTISTGIILNQSKFLTIYTNNNSLYLLTDRDSMSFFASEKYTLEMLNENLLKERINLEIIKLDRKSFYKIDLDTSQVSHIHLNSDVSESVIEEKSFKININKVPSNKKDYSLLFNMGEINYSNLRLLEDNTNQIKKLKRCKKCILPETFPFIEYNRKGVCNYCLSYKKSDQVSNNLELLKSKLERYKTSDSSPNCIIPLSGGRDSTFVLHYAKKHLDLNPIAFTYDWAMVTDLARRNIARICGILEVENIIVAADIHKKRNFICKNVLAWLRRPHLGMVPLFMAGDKHFFKYTQMTKERTNIDLNIWGINKLENTDFKSGFGGVKPNFHKSEIYSLTSSQKLSLLFFLGKNMLRTPEYINDSLIDNITGHLSRIQHPRKDFFSFFDYYQWNENEINSLIVDEYNWEKAIDTDSTWRIGDGTASFYNYIYYTVAGFSEVDTFRSNQIREGLISRERALELSFIENRPRYENINWYLKSIRVPFKYAVETINSIPKIYGN